MIHVRLDQFEGPLGLLLYLIRKDEMDIYNIPINKITSQYLDYLKQMRELDLEVAGEFVAMAATLILIKSKMLLPQYDENGELIEDTVDPRKELVQRLLEYQMYQAASKELNQRPLLGRDVWARGAREEIPTEEGDIIVDERGLFALISIYRKVMKQVHKNIHNVRAKGQSIAARILEIKDRLIPGTRVTLHELISPLELTSNKVLITFLSLLELTKMGFTTLFQSDTYGDIFIDTKKPIERNVIERVEEYDRKPEDLQFVAEALQAEAGGRNLQEIGDNPGDLSSEEQAASVQNIGEQLGLDTFAPPEQVATDDDILAAEAEMGVREGSVDLDRVDQILANFSLSENFQAEGQKSDVNSTVDLAQDPQNDVPAGEVASVVVESAALNEPLSITDDDFEMAWNSFEKSIESEPISSLSIADAPDPLQPFINWNLAEHSMVESEEAPEDTRSNLAQPNTPLNTPQSSDGSVSGAATQAHSDQNETSSVQADRHSEPQKELTPEQKVSSLAYSAKASLSLFDDEPDDFIIENKSEIKI